MKKLVFMFVAAMTLGLMSCGGNTESVSNANDSDTVVVDSVDSVLDCEL